MIGRARLTWMPWLEENLSPDLVHLAGHLGPSICVVLVVHYRRVGPFGTVQANKGALCDDKPGAVPRSVGVMFDIRLGRLISIGASISRHGPHANTIAQLNPIPEIDWLEKLRHCNALDD